MHLIISFVKWQPFCLGLIVLKTLRPAQNEQHTADDHLKYISWIKWFWLKFQLSLLISQDQIIQQVCKKNLEVLHPVSFMLILIYHKILQYHFYPGHCMLSDNKIPKSHDGKQEHSPSIEFCRTCISFDPPVISQKTLGALHRITENWHVICILDCCLVSGRYPGMEQAKWDT